VQVHERRASAQTYSRDGVRVRLLANINLLHELKLAQSLNAEGIGLYRTEFPFIVRNDFPSEEEQYRIYRAVVEAMPDREVTFRTLDVWGDKTLEHLPKLGEANPFLGLRAIRFSLRNRDIFVQQLRAILRSGADAPLKIMFPFISSVDDFLLAREMVIKSQQELEAEGVLYHRQPQLGAMIELPSAVELADELAQVGDFFSIGTNDLIQYMLAVDRTNALVSDLYLPHHPAVLRVLKRIANAAHHHGIELSLCGELGTNLKMLPFLLGIGIHTLSMDADMIPTIQAKIAEIDVRQSERLAEELLRLGKISEVEEHLGLTSQ
jgi:phosphotransferase system enzyme I (PtsP)